MIIRVHKTKDYTVMSNSHLRDMKMSLKGKGLLSVMLSLPDEWDYSIEGLKAILPEGSKAIRSGLKELEDCGYLVRTMERKNDGTFSYRYDVFEQPSTQGGYAVEGNADVGTQIIKEIENTEKEIDKKDRRDKRAWPHPLTDRLIESGYVREDDPEIDEYDEWFRNASFEGYDYKILRSATWYFIDHFKATKGKDETGEPIRDRLSYMKTSIRTGAKRLKKEEENIL